MDGKLEDKLPKVNLNLPKVCLFIYNVKLEPEKKTLLSRQELPVPLIPPYNQYN